MAPDPSTERFERALLLLRLMHWTQHGARAMGYLAVLNGILVIIAVVTGNWPALLLAVVASLALAGASTLLARYARRLGREADVLVAEIHDALI